jgi:hypothetical protein
MAFLGRFKLDDKPLPSSADLNRRQQHHILFGKLDDPILVAGGDSHHS